MDEKPLISEEFEMGAKVIGRVVVESARICNEITAKNDQNGKELVDLVLTRCELSKATILDIVKSEVTITLKQKLMEDEEREAYDYFDSVLAQIC